MLCAISYLFMTTHSLFHNNYVQVGRKAPLHGRHRGRTILKPNQGETGFNCIGRTASLHLGIDFTSL